jgi:hypothetical protein
MLSLDPWQLVIQTTLVKVELWSPSAMVWRKLGTPTMYSIRLVRYPVGPKRGWQVPG